MAVIIRKSSNPAWRVPADFAIDLRASVLADRVAGVILDAHKKAILAGTRASDGVAQPPLNPKGQSGRAAAQGRRPDARGNTGSSKGFPRTLRRGRTKKARSDTNTTVVIETAGVHTPWLEREHGRGVDYLFLDGDVGQAIEDATMVWLEEVTRPTSRGKR